MAGHEKPLVGILMGSKSDWETMKNVSETLDKFGVPSENRVLSAHRTPKETAEYVTSAAGRGLEVLVAGAGGAAHAALFAVAILAGKRPELSQKLANFRSEQAAKVLRETLP